MTNMYVDYMNIKTSNLSNSSNEMGQPFKCIERYKKVKKKIAKPSVNPCLLLGLWGQNSFRDSLAPFLLLTYGEMH